MEPIVRAVAERAYERGARFVDPTYFDPYVKRSRLQHAPDDSLEFVPEWYGKRMLPLGDVRAARIVFVPRVSPGILNGVDPKRAGRDQLPDIRERLEIINKRLVNWTIMPFPTQPWAELVYPDLNGEAALARLTEELSHVCRLDGDYPVAGLRASKRRLQFVAGRRGAEGGAPPRHDRQWPRGALRGRPSCRHPGRQRRRGATRARRLRRGRLAARRACARLPRRA